MEILSIIGAVFFVIFFFGFCIFIHELGHFLVAKWRGLYIVAFSIGFKKVWGFTWKGVEYRIGCLPFGGYVDLPQIDPSNEEVKMVDGKELPPVKPVDRLLTAFAGPFFNIISGFALGILVWVYGVPQLSPKMKNIVVQTVEQESPEYKAGLRTGDKIVEMNGEPINCSWEKFVHRVLFTVGKVNLTVKRGDETRTITYEPKPNPHYMSQEKIAYPFFTPDIPYVLTPDLNSPAEKAGVKAGDLLLAINGKKIADMKSPYEVLSTLSSPKLDLLVKRGDKEVEIKNIISKENVDKGYYVIGVTLSPDHKINTVRANSPASRAKLKAGDILIAINNRKLAEDDLVINLMSESKGKPVDLTIERNGKPFTINITPEPYKSYNSGIDLKFMAHPTPWDQFTYVIEMSFKSLRGIYYHLAHKAGVTKKNSSIKPRNMSGPIGIVRLMFLAVYHGSFIQGIYIVVIISFSLGLLNLFPLPILDGGHILFAIIEMLMGKPLPHKYVQPVNIACVFFLISFMLYVTVFDIGRFIGPGKSSQTTAKETTEKSAPAQPAEKASNVPATTNP